ncbi:hypothetical protein [Undibacter mobilis]|uniref:Uncharacterized protein n=1 Tax=Undibacter mobilis TaxID=2292256 RepID=A0A371B9F6_9BRAD|nr:hypothetical protein [Undibacter mobilis]RDV04208.1 hypothetical protein DXH78_06190 [Undibacter mobilis]
MALKSIGTAILAAALIGAAATPAAAEFFGCKEPRSKVSYSSSADRHAFEAYNRSHHSSRVTYDSAPRRERSAGLFAPYSARNQRW